MVSACLTHIVILSPDPVTRMLDFTYERSSKGTYAPSGASSLRGTSRLLGNFVQLGSHGIEVAVLLRVKKSVTCVKRLFVSDFLSVILMQGEYICSRRLDIK
jgi:hypothetical protein